MFGQDCLSGWQLRDAASLTHIVDYIAAHVLESQKPHVWAALPLWQTAEGRGQPNTHNGGGMTAAKYNGAIWSQNVADPSLKLVVEEQQ
eukprot:scaffold39515_cov14-Tisochrysis_lutea.AAC.1